MDSNEQKKRELSKALVQLLDGHTEICRTTIQLLGVMRGLFGDDKFRPLWTRIASQNEARN